MLHCKGVAHGAPPQRSHRHIPSPPHPQHTPHLLLRAQAPRLASRRRARRLRQLCLAAAALVTRQAGGQGQAGRPRARYAAAASQPSKQAVAAHRRQGRGLLGLLLLRQLLMLLLLAGSPEAAEQRIQCRLLAGLP